MVVDSNNQARTLNDDEQNQGQSYDQGQRYDQGQGHYKSRQNNGDHDHYPAHDHDDNHVHRNSDKLSNQQYENALVELLRVRFIYLYYYEKNLAIKVYKLNH